MSVEALIGHLSVDPEMVFQLVLAVVLGAVIGLEREVRGRSAGLRTLSIVCLGSTLIMLVSSQLIEVAPSGAEQRIQVDPGRIAAGIVTGIGFLGAGVIIKLGDLIRGVTTAASIWFVAGLGLAIGQRHYALAVIAAGLALGVLWLLNFLERRIPPLIYRTVAIRARASDSARVLEAARALVDVPGNRLMDLYVEEDLAGGVTQIELAVRTHQSFQAHGIVKQIATLDGVEHVRWH
jgi:putative Mg2+ transporter-C (MgtC) family protein